MAVAGFFLLANYGERNPAARVVTIVLIATLAGLVLVVSTLSAVIAILRYIAGAQTSTFASTESLAVPLTIAATMSLLYLVRPVQLAVARVLRLRPGSPVHYTAVVIALLLFAFQLGTQLSTDVLTAIANSPPFTEADLLSQEIPLILVALAGVGVFVRRSSGETLDRLGLRYFPKWWWALSLAAIVVFLAIGFGIDNLANWLTPQTQKRVSDASQVVFHSLNNPPAIIVLGLSAGVAEELVFRGAMQPRFGILPTALLFAAVHTQYGITFATLEVFLIGIGLGVLRNRAGTVACIVSHAGYDIIVGLLALPQ